MESSFNFIGAHSTWSHIQKLKGFEGAIVYCTTLARTICIIMVAGTELRNN